MATKSIGKDVVMVSVPMPVDLSRKLGRKAMELDKSKADVARRLIRAFLEGKITLPCVAVLFASAVAMGNGLSPSQYDGDDDFRMVRNSRRVKKVRRGKDPFVWEV